jgi:hypothetical protein
MPAKVENFLGQLRIWVQCALNQLFTLNEDYDLKYNLDLYEIYLMFPTSAEEIVSTTSSNGFFHESLRKLSTLALP